MAAPARPTQTEFVVRVPKRIEAKKYSVMKFSGALNLDVTNWADEGNVVRMEREDHRAEVVGEVKQEFGAGTEYGKAARDEARRKKYGRQLRTYHHDNQPWQFSLQDAAGKKRQFRSIREGGAGEHADYWLFLKSGENQFDAVKVDDWYQFMPVNSHRTLDSEQAEERFLERGRVMNQFALKAQIQRQLKSNEDESGVGEKSIEGKTKGLKIKDEASSDEDEDQQSDSGRVKDVDFSASSSKKSKKTNGKSKTKKNAKVKAERKDKKVRVEDGDEIAAYESEDGEDEGREYDYMSDSGTDSDRDNVPMEDKVEKALVGVGDETGLKKMIGGDSEYDDSSDSESGDDAAKKLFSGKRGKDDEEDIVRKRRIADIDERGSLYYHRNHWFADSSGSDSDDPDKEKIDSVVFLPKKSTPDSEETIAVVNAEAALALTRKRAGDAATEDGTSGTEAKKVKLEETAVEPEGLTEETVRKYLRRKPHTTKELLAKVKSKCSGMSKPEIVTKLAAILKRIEPQQTKQMVGKKQVLYFSLSNREA